MRYIRVLVFLFVTVVANSYSFATDAGPAKECVTSLDRINSAAAFIKNVKKTKSAKAEALEIINRAAAESKKMAKTKTATIDDGNTFTERIDTNLKSLLQESEVSLSDSINIIESFAVNKKLNRVVLVPNRFTNKYNMSGAIVAQLHQNGRIEFLNWIAKPSAQSGTYSHPEFIGDSNVLRITKSSYGRVDIQFYDLTSGKKELNSLSEVLNLNFSSAIAFSDTVYLVEVEGTREIIIFEYNALNQKAQIFHKAQPSSNEVMKEIFDGKNVSAEVIGTVLKLTTPEMTLVVDRERNMVVPNKNFDDEGPRTPLKQVTVRADLVLSEKAANYIVGISPMAISENPSINGTINLVIIPTGTAKIK